jgi:hypothetical protein
MNAQTIDHFVALLRSHIWIPLLALFVFAIIRLSKSDAGVAWFPCRIKATSRPLWALGLGIVGGVLEQLFAGGTVLAAIVGGMVAGMGAIVIHEIVVNTIRKGRDLGIKPRIELVDEGDK